MVTSTAFATRLGWSVSPGMPWSISPGMGGQLAPECGGHVHQNLHIDRFFGESLIASQIVFSLQYLFVFLFFSANASLTIGHLFGHSYNQTPALVAKYFLAKSLKNAIKSALKSRNAALLTKPSLPDLSVSLELFLRVISTYPNILRLAKNQSPADLLLLSSNSKKSFSNLP